MEVHQRFKAQGAKNDRNKRRKSSIFVVFKHFPIID